MRLRYFGAGGEAHAFETEERSMAIGSGEECDLRLPGLGALECTIYLSEQGYYARNEGGRLRINGVDGPGFVRVNDVLQLGSVMAFRFDIVPDAPPPEMAGDRRPGTTAAPRHTAGPAPSEQSPGGRHGHSPAAAAVLSTLFPGAGQAYNGQPVKAFMILLPAVLVAPWLAGIWDAHRIAKRIVEQGGWMGGGGAWGVLLHLWLFLDLGLLALVILTLKGVLT